MNVDRVVGGLLGLGTFCVVMVGGLSVPGSPGLVVGLAASWAAARARETLLERLAYADEVLGLAGGDASR